MKRTAFLFSLITLFVSNALAIVSPDGKLAVNVTCDNGKPAYSVSYNGVEYLKTAPLGLMTNIGDFTKNLTMVSSEVKVIDETYRLYNIKRLNNHFVANSQSFTFKQNDKEVMEITFLVSDNNIAFRYGLMQQGDTRCTVVDNEATTFSMTDGTTTFLCPQMGEMTGFARTAPSYETHYDADGVMGKNGWGTGYTFPCLFKSPAEKGNAWILISETGSAGTYPGCKIESTGATTYKVAFPSAKENNGFGSTGAQMALPSTTPWRTITISDRLKDIVETTVTWDVLAADITASGMTAEKNEADKLRDILRMKYGRGAWSWIIANDESCNYDTQKEYIDFASAMGWESLLVDALWDTQIGRDRIAELARYAKEKGVALYLWYNSNGQWNDAPQTPRNCMDVPAKRQQEMAWMQSIGIRGIKVDFFGGDKQCTMQLYRDILMDAQQHDLLVIFHGCTLPRGWEMMFPNYVASEAVRASENLHFSQGECDREAMDACFLPFLRNTVGSMDFGGSALNWYYNPRNDSTMWGGHRVTSDVFAIATSVLFQSAVQHFALAPNNMTDAPAWAIDFMKRVPTTWEDVRFIDGYPGKFIILARKSQAGKWYLTAVNGQKQPLRYTLPLDMFKAGSTVTLYSDDAKLNGSKKSIKVSKKQTLTVTIPVNSGLLIEE